MLPSAAASSSAVVEGSSPHVTAFLSPAVSAATRLPPTWPLYSPAIAHSQSAASTPSWPPSSASHILPSAFSLSPQPRPVGLSTDTASAFPSSSFDGREEEERALLDPFSDFSSSLPSPSSAAAAFVPSVELRRERHRQLDVERRRREADLIQRLGRAADASRSMGSAGGQSQPRKAISSAGSAQSA